ncbi:MAG TPA: lysoplasmalogenase [Candidatus Sulfomarinibacteraceae bacterium]|nr:lysoplasmalogenase [Candidatus Sulfomarinibacteraceae bacterium]
MSGPVQAVLVAASVAAVVDWLAVARDEPRIERLAKPAVIVALIGAVLLSDPSASPARLLLVAALAASLVGDWLLLPPVRFVGGLVAFLVAHLAYLAIFLLGDLDAGLAFIGAGASVALLVTLGRAILAGAARGGMGGPVVAYFGAICLMAIAATATGSPAATAGAWLFVASDSMLGWDRFAAPPPVTRGAASRRRLVVIVTYHAAQILLTVGILGSFVS